jgi:hypothetical protein
MTRSVASIGKGILAPDPGLGACLYSIGYGKVNCKEFHAPKRRNININLFGTTQRFRSKQSLSDHFAQFAGRL